MIYLCANFKLKRGIMDRVRKQVECSEELINSTQRVIRGVEKDIAGVTVAVLD